MNRSCRTVFFARGCQFGLVPRTSCVHCCVTSWPDSQPEACSSQPPGVARCAQQTQPLAPSSRAHSRDMRCTTYPHCLGAAHQSSDSTRPTSSAQRTGAHRAASAGTGTGSRREELVVVGSTPSPRTTSSSVSSASTASSSPRGHLSICFRCAFRLLHDDATHLPIKLLDALEIQSYAHLLCRHRTHFDRRPASGG